MSIVRARFDDPLHGQLDEVGLAVVPGGAWGTTAVFASPVPRPLPPSRTDSSAFSILWPPFRRLLKNGAFANGTGWMPINWTDEPDHQESGSLVFDEIGSK